LRSRGARLEKQLQTRPDFSAGVKTALNIVYEQFGGIRSALSIDMDLYCPY
jgi:hypothetical protein